MLALKGRRTERVEAFGREFPGAAGKAEAAAAAVGDFLHRAPIIGPLALPQLAQAADLAHRDLRLVELRVERRHVGKGRDPCLDDRMQFIEIRSEEHTSELQSLMRISYAVFCLKKK